MQHAICYISTSTVEFTDNDIEEQMEKWCKNNLKRDIKGVLLYSQGHFFQVLEGEKKVVLALFNEIRQDTRHNNIIQVLGEDISQGSLDHYIVENLKDSQYSKPHLVKEYCESVKGMEPHTQQQIKVILGAFIDTQVL